MSYHTEICRDAGEEMQWFCSAMGGLYDKCIGDSKYLPVFCEKIFAFLPGVGQALKNAADLTLDKNQTEQLIQAAADRGFEACVLDNPEEYGGWCAAVKNLAVESGMAAAEFLRNQADSFKGAAAVFGENFVETPPGGMNKALIFCMVVAACCAAAKMAEKYCPDNSMSRIFAKARSGISFLAGKMTISCAKNAITSIYRYFFEEKHADSIESLDFNEDLDNISDGGEPAERMTAAGLKRDLGMNSGKKLGLGTIQRLQEVKTNEATV